VICKGSVLGETNARCNKHHQGNSILLLYNFTNSSLHHPTIPHPTQNMASTLHKDPVADWYFKNANAERISTETALVRRLERLYPQKHITIVPEASCNLLAYAASGNATIIPDNDNITNSGPLEWEVYLPPTSRLDGGSGHLGKKVLFGKYKLIWSDYEFVLYLVEGRDGDQSYPAVRNSYVISNSSNSTSALILAAGKFGVALHGEIWVFDQGYWQKDAQLWKSIQKSRWEDVILDPEMKKTIIGDVNRFFDGRATYERLKVPWKRGIIYHGPPGNGKTISIKATMHMLYDRKDPIPTLYVKTLAR
jgi:transitional endoplasmic reticulum ATPase